MPRGKLNRGGQLGRQVRVGLVLLLALLFLILAVWQVGRLFDVFSPRYDLVALVETSGGIIEGAPVTLAGQRIGQVDQISFIPIDERVEGKNIRMRLSISRNIQEQIRRDSEATLRTQGVLGDRFIDISPGSPRFPALAPGDTIPANPPLDFEAMLQTAAGTLDQVQGVLTDLEGMTERLALGEGTLGALLADDRLYDRMAGATTELGVLIGRINRADGTITRLIDDPEMYHRMNAALTRLDSLTSVALAGEGTLGRLLRDDALYDGVLGVVGRADTAVAGMDLWLRGLTEADGTVARLMEDPELYDQLLRAVVEVQNLIRDIRADPRRFRPEVRVDVF